MNLHAESLGLSQNQPERGHCWVRGGPEHEEDRTCSKQRHYEAKTDQNQVRTGQRQARTLGADVNTEHQAVLNRDVLSLLIREEDTDS